MKQRITFTQFHDGFSTRRENFSYAGLAALFEWFEESEEDIGNELEFDPIAICCEFTEYGNIDEYNADYSKDFETWEQVQEYTSVIPLDQSSPEGGFIIQNY